MGSKFKELTYIKRRTITHNAIITAINNVVENDGDFIGAFRENIIRVISGYSTKDIQTEDDDYYRISEQINKLKTTKLRLVQEKKPAESYE